MKTRVERVGGIWHGTIDGHPEVDVRGLTEETARRKVNEIAARLLDGEIVDLKEDAQKSKTGRDFRKPL